MTVTHATFTIERTYPVPPERVFRAFGDPALKERWFCMPDDWVAKKHSLEFRVGGRELSRGGPPDGQVHTFDARYSDIVANERIVYTYDLHLDDQHMSTSIATIELTAVDAGTRMTFTEQGAFFDGLDDVSGREEGTNGLVDLLGAALEAGLGAP